MFKTIKTFFILLTIGTLYGCAVTQKPISLQPTFWANDSIKVGITTTELPKTDLFLPGADCLLCLATATAANSSLNSYSKTLGGSELENFHLLVGERLKAKGLEVVQISSTLKLKDLKRSSGKQENKAKKDFTSYKSSHGLSHLLVIEYKHAGIKRNYSSYVPVSDPVGVFGVDVYIVDLSTNTYIQYEPIRIEKPATGPWDESPNFPALTNAFYQAIAEGKEVAFDIYSGKKVQSIAEGNLNNG